MTNIWDTIREIKTLSHAKRACATLEEMRKALPSSEKDAGITYAYKSTPDHLKIGGVAYFKEVCLSHASKVISTQSHDPSRPLVGKYSAHEVDQAAHYAATVAAVAHAIKAAA